MQPALVKFSMKELPSPDIYLLNKAVLEIYVFSCWDSQQTENRQESLAFSGGQQHRIYLGQKEIVYYSSKLWDLLWWDIWYFTVQIAKSLCCIMLIPISKCSLTASFPVLVILLLAVLVYGKNKSKDKMLRSNLIL